MPTADAPATMNSTASVALTMPPWPMIGTALFATNISAEHYVAYAGGAYSSGFVTGGTELVAALNIVLLALLFLPFYIRLGVFTTPEFLEKRDLIPRVDNSIDLEVTRAGEWTGRCAEFCGLKHWAMRFGVRAVPQDEFDRWVRDQGGRA